MISGQTCPDVRRRVSQRHDLTFSKEWEAIYLQGKQNSVWPWSDVVSYVMRYARPDRSPFRALELGFGAGANISFFRSIGVDYY